MGGVTLEALSLNDAELVGGDAAPVEDEATAEAAILPDSASTEGFVCGYVECEVELTVIKTAKTTIKGAPGGIVAYNFEVQVPSGAPGPVIIDSIVDDAIGDLDLTRCSLTGAEISPGEEDDCSVDAVLPVLAKGVSHTNTVSVKGHVVDPDTGTDTNIPASGQDSLTIGIVEPQLDIEATYTVLTGTYNECAAGDGSAILEVDEGSTFYHCIFVTNTGSTAIVSVKVTFPGVGGTFNRLRMPGTLIDGVYAAGTAEHGTTEYTYEIEVTDEWGDTLTKTVKVTVFNGILNK
ncbi:MAG: hypothetical protein ACC652_11985 [Acidimicrobiales bacterium]